MEQGNVRERETGDLGFSRKGWYTSIKQCPFANKSFSLQQVEQALVPEFHDEKHGFLSVCPLVKIEYTQWNSCMPLVSPFS